MEKLDNVDFKNKGKQLEPVQSYQGGNIESVAALQVMSQAEGMPAMPETM